MRRQLLLVLVLLVTLPLPASAGIIFGKKPPKPPPQERVPELIKIIKTDGDENKRADAVEELRQYDPAQFPEIMPTLIDALLNDKKASVRVEAAHSISKLRPVSQAAGHALEKALADDPSMRARMQIRSALLAYQWAGYRSNGKKEDPLLTNKEPPLADPQEKGPPVLPVGVQPLPPGPAIPPSPQQGPGPSLGLPSAPVPVPVPAPRPEPKGPDLN
jgi:HEAT repeats